MATPTSNTRPLTKTQLDYAIGKLTVALAVRRENAVAVIKKPAPVPTLTAEEKYKLIITGKAKILPLDEVRHTYLMQAHTYPEQEAKVKIYEAAMVKYNKECEPIIKRVEGAYREAMDTLVMGNAEAALAVVASFAAGK